MDNFRTDGFRLGFGLMRLPTLADGSIDVEQTAAMADAFLEAGGTYFDTAFVYPGSELAIRKALFDRHPRESFTIATKLNARVAKDAADARQQFFTSLERLNTDYVDYYLLHAISKNNVKSYEDYGIWDFVKEQKAAGKIRHIGFSFHDYPDLLEKLLTEHPEAEFVQLQMNYADWESPGVRSRANYETVRKFGKLVTVMEPVKGGTLADPPRSVRALLDAAEPKASYASWAIRYIASLDGILTVLSGMSNLAQMEDNLSYMKDFRPLNESEQGVIRAAQEAMAAVETIPCTACGYCVEGCPMSINIPGIFRARNQQLVFENDGQAKREYGFATRGKGKASDCVHCLQCEDACPQKLPITELLESCAELLE